MLARCPACHTVFRVRSEQLRAHHGQVRCGSCLLPFDAVDNLIEEAPPPAGPKAPDPASDRSDRFFVLEDKPADTFSDQLDFELPDALVPQRVAPRAPEDARQEPVERTLPLPSYPSDDDVDAGRDAVASSAAPGTIDPANDALQAPTATDESHPEPERRDDDDTWAPLHLDDAPTWQNTVPRQQPESAEESPDAQERSAASPNLTAPHVGASPRSEEFCRAEGSRPALTEAPTDSEDDFADYAPPARPPARRALTGLAVGLLSGMLAAQLLYLFRADIARNWPSLRPALVKACDALGCTVELPRIANLISVESSDLQSEPGKAAHFVLNATIRNRAPHPLAWPHLELTLTDARDRPLVRRVLAPQDWFPAADLTQGFAAGRDIAVTLPFSANGLGATGYRIYAFYP